MRFQISTSRSIPWVVTSIKQIRKKLPKSNNRHWGQISQFQLTEHRVGLVHSCHSWCLKVLAYRTVVIVVNCIRRGFFPLAWLAAVTTAGSGQATDVDGSAELEHWSADASVEAATAEGTALVTYVSLVSSSSRCKSELSVQSLLAWSSTCNKKKVFIHQTKWITAHNLNVA